VTTSNRWLAFLPTALLFGVLMAVRDELPNEALRACAAAAAFAVACYGLQSLRRRAEQPGSTAWALERLAVSAVRPRRGV
jgi:hypothetical protein